MLNKNGIKMFILIVFIVFIFGLVIFQLLPIQLKYYSKINRGTKIIEELDIYYKINGLYPHESNWLTIENIYRKSFLKDNEEFNEATQPYYSNKNNEYTLHYVFGFDPPYLFYSSITKKWRYGNLP
jgi:hypothetical protein